MPAQRGVIRNVNRAMQLNNFKDLLRKSPVSKNMTITPTDIDGVWDYNGKYFVYIEGKLIGKATDPGQRFALQNIINSHWKAGNPAMALIYEHDIPVSEQIPVAYCFTRMIYCHRQIVNLCGKRWGDSFWWFPQTSTTKVLTAIENFEKEFQIYK